MKGGEHKLYAPRKNLIETRKRFNLTQEELAKKVDISRAYLANIEAGKHTPSLEVAYNLAKVLNTSVEDLFL